MLLLATLFLLSAAGLGSADEEFEVDAAAEAKKFLSSDKERWLSKAIGLPKLKYADTEFRNVRADILDVAVDGPVRLYGHGLNEFNVELEVVAKIELDSNATVGTYSGPLTVTLDSARLSVAIQVFDKFEPTCRTRLDTFRINRIKEIVLARNNVSYGFDAKPGDFTKILAYLNENLNAANVEKHLNVRKYESYICI